MHWTYIALLVLCLLPLVVPQRQPRRPRVVSAADVVAASRRGSPLRD